jgi:hypothetical protein
MKPSITVEQFMTLDIGNVVTVQEYKSTADYFIVRKPELSVTCGGLCHSYGNGAYIQEDLQPLGLKVLQNGTCCVPTLAFEFRTIPLKSILSVSRVTCHLVLPEPWVRKWNLWTANHQAPLTFMNDEEWPFQQGMLSTTLSLEDRKAFAESQYDVKTVFPFSHSAISVEPWSSSKLVGYIDNESWKFHYGEAERDDPRDMEKVIAESNLKTS